jgi:hypothetical protein
MLRRHVRRGGVELKKKLGGKGNIHIENEITRRGTKD